LRAAGFAIDHRSGADLVPHITLARRTRCASLPRLGTPIGWRVGEFALVESHLHPSAATTGRWPALHSRSRTADELESRHC
jgi:2'-5' RNA ligase